MSRLEKIYPSVDYDSDHFYAVVQVCFLIDEVASITV